MRRSDQELRELARRIVVDEWPEGWSELDEYQRIVALVSAPSVSDEEVPQVLCFVSALGMSLNRHVALNVLGARYESLFGSLYPTGADLAHPSLVRI